MNIDINVDIWRSALDLERQLAEVLRQLLEDASWLRGWSVEPAKDHAWDLRASGAVPDGGKAVLCVEVKKNFTPIQFHSLVNRPCDSGRDNIASRVLAMPHVSPRLAAICREHGWSWFDLAGNCRLEIPGVLLIERLGNRPIKAEPRAGANLGTPEAGRVVRALLAPENAGQRWTQREIVRHFDDLPTIIPAPSLALVNKVVQHFRDQAFLEPLPDRGFRVRDYEGLLRAWREAYRFNRHSRRRCFTLLRDQALQERLRAFDSKNPARAMFGVFSAADVQAPAVRQPRSWIFVDTFGERALMTALDAKPVDSGENLVVLVADDLGVFYKAEIKPGRMACTNAAQTYVDLAHAGGRGDEAAQAILQQRLKPAWSAAAQ